MTYVRAPSKETNRARLPSWWKAGKQPKRQNPAIVISLTFSWTYENSTCMTCVLGSGFRSPKPDKVLALLYSFGDFSYFRSEGYGSSKSVYSGNVWYATCSRFQPGRGVFAGTTGAHLCFA